MIHKHGPVETARRLVLTAGGTAGFARCWEEGRLELSVKAIILGEEFRPLFDPRAIFLSTARPFRTSLVAVNPGQEWSPAKLDRLAHLSRAMQAIVFLISAIQ
jgi:hypothetical protein